MRNFKDNIKASAFTLKGVVHLILTIIIISAVCFWNSENDTIIRVVILVSVVLAYFISNVDFQTKRENLKKIKK